MISETDTNSELQKHSDFSIEHILNKAGTSFSRNGTFSAKEHEVASPVVFENFHWLQCSRYCPPKVPRIQRKEPIQKRQLGRHPRIPFTSTQLSILEQKFKESPYLSSDEVINLSQKLLLADIRVKIWFQNRRARERREKNHSLTSASKNQCHIKEEIKKDTETISEVRYEKDYENSKNLCLEYNNIDPSPDDSSTRRGYFSMSSSPSIYKTNSQTHFFSTQIRGSPPTYLTNSPTHFFNSQSVPLFIPLITYSNLNKSSPDSSFNVKEES